MSTPPEVTVSTSRRTLCGRSTASRAAMPPPMDRGLSGLTAETGPAEILLGPLGRQQGADRLPEIRRGAGAGEEQDFGHGLGAQLSKKHRQLAPLAQQITPHGAGH